MRRKKENKKEEAHNNQDRYYSFMFVIREKGKNKGYSFKKKIDFHFYKYILLK
jgi:hypothetical protein